MAPTSTASSSPTSPVPSSPISVMTTSSPRDPAEPIRKAKPSHGRRQSLTIRVPKHDPPHSTPASPKRSPVRRSSPSPSSQALFTLVDPIITLASFSSSSSSSPSSSSSSPSSSPASSPTLDPVVSLDPKPLHHYPSVGELLWANPKRYSDLQLSFQTSSPPPTLHLHYLVLIQSRYFRDRLSSYNHPTPPSPLHILIRLAPDAPVTQGDMEAFHTTLRLMYTKAFSREFHEDLTRAQRILRVCVELGFKEGIQESWLWLAQRCRRDGAISTWKDLTLTYPQLARRFSPAVENLGIWTSGPSSDGEGEREEARSKVDPAWSRPKDVGQRRVFPSENSSREGVDKKEAAEEEEEQVKSEEVKFEEERDKASPLISSPPLTSRRRGGDGLERPSASTLAQCATSDPVGPKRRLLTAWLAKCEQIALASTSSGSPLLSGHSPGSTVFSMAPSLVVTPPPMARLLPSSPPNQQLSMRKSRTLGSTDQESRETDRALASPTPRPSPLPSSTLPCSREARSSHRRGHRRQLSQAGIQVPPSLIPPVIPVRSRSVSPTRRPSREQASGIRPGILLGGGKGLGGGGGTSSSHGSGGGAGGMSGGSRRRVGGGKREGVEDQAPHILEAILALLTSGEATSSEAFGYLLRLLEAMRMEMMAKPSTSPLSSSPSRASDTTLLSLSDGVDEAMSRLVREGLAVKDKEILRPLFGLCSSPSSSEPRGGPSRRDGVWEGPKTRTELVRSRPGAPTLRTEGDIKEGMEGEGEGQGLPRLPRLPVRSRGRRSTPSSGSSGSSSPLSSWSFPKSAP